jgi:nucleoside transporter
MSDAALQPPAPASDWVLKSRLSLMMFLQYFVQGCYLPVISLYLQDALGFSLDEIGKFGAAIAVGPLVAPFFIGQIVDRHVATQHVLSFCHLAGGVLMLALYYATEFWPIIILGAAYSTLYVPSMMLTNSLSFHHLKNRDREFPIIRLFGTIGFILPAWLVEMYFLKGLEGDALDTGRGVVLALSGIVGLAMGVYSLTLPHTPPKRKADADLAPGKVAGLLRYRYFLVLILVSLLIAVVHKFYFVLNSPFLKAVLEKGAIADAWEQRISSIGQISEVAVMAGLGLAITRIGFKATMLCGIFAYLLRCVIFAGAISLDVSFPVVMSLVCIGQALHGFCFGCFMAAAFIYVDRVATADVRGSMQNLYGTFILSLGFVIGGFVAGGIGSLFTTTSTGETLRERLGITATAGLTAMVEKDSIERIRDWPGIWLSGAALSALALICFALFFPKEVPSEGDKAG